MTTQPNRLVPPGDRGFAQRDIDRGRPLSFLLDGVPVHGYSGDTVLSATLASGIVSAGTWRGEPLALDERFAPAIVPAAEAANRDLALPMDRTPATAGAEWATLGWAGSRASRAGRIGRLARLLRGAPQTLAIAFERRGRPDAPWLDLLEGEVIEADLVVVGAGVAGLSAAIAAAEAGETVVVLERRPFAGGDAAYFGVIEDEEPPLETMTRLLARGAALSNVRLFTRTLAVSAHPGEVRAHRVEVRDGRVMGRRLVLKAGRVVLATGCLERLPAVPGNRLPGVVGSMAAFHRAERYGVWIGLRAAFATGVSQAWRVAIRAHDTGLAVPHVLDARPAPSSRFIDFAKATGIQPRFGQAVSGVEPPARGRRGRLVRVAATLSDSPRPQPVTADQVVLAAGWQPDLALWLGAGGACAWSAQDGAFRAEGGLAGMALAGSAAGFRSTTACVVSGAAAVAALFGRQVEPIDDPSVDPTFETDDLPPPVPLASRRGATSFLDGGASLSAMPLAPGERPTRLPGLAPRGGTVFADGAAALSLADIGAGIAAGLLPAAEAERVARARALAPLRLGGRPREPAVRSAGPAMPIWLSGRFGRSAALWRVQAGDARMFEPGCLVFVSLDATDPRAAVGVVVEADGGPTGRAVVLLAGDRVTPESRLVVRDVGGAVPVSVLGPAAS